MIHGRDYLILSIRAGKQTPIVRLINQFQSNIDGSAWIISCLANRVFVQHYLAYYSPTLLPNNLSQSSDVVKRYGTNYLVFLFFHEFGTCGWSSTCFIPSLRRLSLLTFRPHLQPKVFHINLRHTSPSTLTITWFGIDASGPSDAASCPNLRARRSPHSISHYRLQIVQYCFPDMPTSAPYQLSRKLDMALLLQPCYVDW